MAKFEVPAGQHIVDVQSLKAWTVIEVWWIGVGTCRVFLLDEENATAFAENPEHFESAVSASSTESPVMMVVPDDGHWHVGVRFDVDGDIFTRVLTGEVVGDDIAEEG